MVDLHCHILPGIDDGAENTDESIRLVKMELKNGVDTIAVTPHFHPDYIGLPEFLEKRAKAAETLRLALERNHIKAGIVQGAEVYLSPLLLKDFDLSKLCYAGTRFVLTEFPMSDFSQWIPEVLYRFRLEGITPVIAHVERYPYILKGPEILYKLVCQGSLAQVNANSLIEPGKTRNAVFSFIRHNLVHVIASDTHSVKRRPPNIHRAMNVIDHKFGARYVGYYESNSRLIAEGIEPDLMEPVDPKKKLWGFLFGR